MSPLCEHPARTRARQCRHPAARTVSGFGARMGLVALLLALSGCASIREPSPAEHVPPAAPVAAPHPEVLNPPVAPPPAPLAAVNPIPIAEQFDDLFDRIRSGFALGDIENVEIDRQLDWYATHPQYLERTFDRSQRYLYHIVTEIEARKMPLELALLPVVESAFEPFGYSHASAAGLWQFIGPTGTRFGLKQNWWYDGRRDVLESTRAALDYLQALHAEFGDWLLAVAAYNCGENNVRRAVASNAAAGRPTDFWNLKLPRETRAYVPKLLAMRQLVGAPALHGLEFSPIPNEPFFAKVDTGGQIDLKMAAELAGITPEDLTYLNPGFNRWATDPAGPHRLLVPVEAAEIFTEGLSLIPEDERLRITRHEVKKGDTLASVARRHGTSVAVLKQMNALPSQQLRAGQTLLLPGSGPALHPKVAAAAARVDRGGGRSRIRAAGRSFHVVRSGESLWSISQKHGVDMRTLAKMNGMKAGDKLPAGRKLALSVGGKRQAANDGDGKRLSYTVRRGDTFSAIARRFNVSVSQLMSWNGLAKSHLLKPGQRLVMYLVGERNG